MAHHDDKAFMSTFVAILGALVALAIIIFFIAHQLQHPEEMDKTAMAERIKPVGHVVIAGTEEATKVMAEVHTPTAATTGGDAKSPAQQIYESTCSGCHASGIAGAPKFADKDEWGNRMKEQGLATIYQTAISGKGGMPPKGGRADLSDDQFKDVVNYLLAAAGLGPDAGKAAPQAQAVPAAPAAAPAAASPPAAAGDAGLARGKEIFEMTCVACHGAGVAGAPKFGDKAAWGERLAKGIDAVYQTALNGKGAMPPKGGRIDLSDEDIKHAIDYMVHAAR